PVRTAECGMRNGPGAYRYWDHAPGIDPGTSIPHSAFRIPHSALQEPSQSLLELERSNPEHRLDGVRRRGASLDQHLQLIAGHGSARAEPVERSRGRLRQPERDMEQRREGPRGAEATEEEVRD